MENYVLTRAAPIETPKEISFCEPSLLESYF